LLGTKKALLLLLLLLLLIKLEGPWPLQGVESDFLITSSRKEALQDIYRENPAAHKGGVPGHG